MEMKNFNSLENIELEYFKEIQLGGKPFDWDLNLELDNLFSYAYDFEWLGVMGFIENKVIGGYDRTYRNDGRKETSYMLLGACT